MSIPPCFFFLCFLFGKFSLTSIIVINIDEYDHIEPEIKSFVSALIWYQFCILEQLADEYIKKPFILKILSNLSRFHKYS